MAQYMFETSQYEIQVWDKPSWINKVALSSDGK